MADDAGNHSGSIPGPIPQVRDEGLGGSDLNFTTDTAGAEGAEGPGGPGSLPETTRHGSTDDRGSSD